MLRNRPQLRVAKDCEGGLALAITVHAYSNRSRVGDRAIDWTLAIVEVVAAVFLVLCQS